MKIKRRNALSILLLICCFSLVGCVTPKSNYRPEAKDISFPPLNKIMTVNIGDEMVKQGTYTELDGIHISNPVQASWAYTLSAGDYVKKGEDRTREFYMPATGPGEVSKKQL